MPLRANRQRRRPARQFSPLGPGTTSSLIRRDPQWRRTDALNNNSGSAGGGWEKVTMRRQAFGAGRRRHVREEDLTEDSELSDSPQSQPLASKVVPCCHKAPFDPPPSDTRSGIGGANPSGFFGRLDPNQFMLACYAQLYTQYYKAYASRSEGVDLSPPFPDRDSYARLRYASQPGRRPDLPVMSGSEYRRVTLIETPDKQPLTQSSSRFSGMPAMDLRTSTEDRTPTASLQRTPSKKEEGEKKIPAQKLTEISTSNHSSGQSLVMPDKVSTCYQSKHSSGATAAKVKTEKDADEEQSLEEGEAVDDDDDEDSGETENSDEGTDCVETAPHPTNEVAQRLKGNSGQRHRDPIEYDSPPSRRVNIERPLRNYVPSPASGLSDLQFPFEVPPYLLSLMASSINFPELANRQLNDYLTNSIKTVPFLPIVLKNAFGTSFPIPTLSGEQEATVEDSGRHRREAAGGGADSGGVLSSIPHSRISMTKNREWSQRESPKKSLSTSKRSSKRTDRRQGQRSADSTASPPRPSSLRLASVEGQKKEIRCLKIQMNAVMDGLAKLELKSKEEGMQLVD
ncbi:unnamed protein product [Schistocephalus solidus]|uniref:Uncharacterized protein n=1 Tax=Schistocephalus solidus TaxID=70667 RepID=A0A183TJ49_SCHSO|nr:unnamed protein product [Schistocephalus solidus]